MPNGITASATAHDPGRTVPSLAEMSRRALELLSADPDGFFLMIEGGQIDWAGHGNDVGTLLHEMLKFDEAIRVVLDWVRSRDDTLVVLTADHETGGLSPSYYRSHSRDAPEKRGNEYVDASVLDRIYAQKGSLGVLGGQFLKLRPHRRTTDRLRAMVNRTLSFPISNHAARRILRTVPNPEPPKPSGYVRRILRIDDFAPFYPDVEGRISALIAREVAGQQGVAWATGTHTTTPVLAGVIGPARWRERFLGLMTGPELGKRLQEALGVATVVPTRGG
jgi:alkaline phosphatase